MKKIKIPEGWQLKKLGLYVLIRSGESPSKFHFQTSGTPYFKVDQLNNCNKYQIDSPYKTNSINPIPSGSIIFPKRGASIFLNKIRIILQDSFLDTNLMALTPNHELYNEYLFYLLDYEKLYKIADTTSIPQINNKHIEPLNFLLPPIAEQRKIAEILGTCDRLIELTEQLITAKRKLKRGLMQKLLTGKLRFPEFEGQKWKTVKLGKLCNIRRGASPRPIGDAKYFSETGRGWIRIADVTACQLYLRQTSQYLSKLGEEKSVKVNSGDLIMSICGTIGVCRIVDIPACIHDGFVLITPKKENINSLFLLYFLNHIANNLSSKGQPGTQKNLNTGIVSRIEIPDYLIKEQIKIKDLFLAFDKEIEILEKRLNNIQDIKKGLMQQLLTGKTRVKID